MLNEKSKISEKNISQNKVTYCELFKNTRYVCAFFAGTVSQFNFMQMEPILAYRLTEKNLNTMKIGLFFTIYPCFYLISSVSLGKFYSKKIEKRVIMILSLIFYSIALTLAGPSELLNYPNSIVLMCAG